MKLEGRGKCEDMGRNVGGHDQNTFYYIVKNKTIFKLRKIITE